MTRAEQYFNQACLRCQEYSVDAKCEVKKNCPVYKLFLLTSKPKSRKESSWSGCQGNCDFEPGLRPEMI